MNLRGVLGVVVVAAGLAGCATTEKGLMEQGLKPLSEAEPKAMHSRTRTVKWTNAQGVSGTGEYRADGNSSVNWGSGGAQGRYRTVGNTFCTLYPEIRGGAENCVKIYKTGNNEYKSYRANGDYNALSVYTN